MKRFLILAAVMVCVFSVVSTSEAACGRLRGAQPIRSAIAAQPVRSLIAAKPIRTWWQNRHSGTAACGHSAGACSGNSCNLN